MKGFMEVVKAKAWVLKGFGKNQAGILSKTERLSHVEEEICK